MLTVNNIYAGYGESEVLHGISIHVQPNEIVAIIGPNGAGKSTVIKALFSIATITQGTITFKEQDITHIPTHELLQLGISYVPQGKINFPDLTIEENLNVGTLFTKEKEVIEKQKQVVFKKFPVLKQRKHALAYTLSGGQQQMLALGRALMQNPSVLLLDEPSLGLSPQLQKELFATIQSLRLEGLTIIIVEQNAKKAIEVADTTYLLEDGKIVLHGDKKILKHTQIKSVYLGGR